MVPRRRCPSHAWNRWRYHYPQRAFPYDDLMAENGRRGKFDPEYELLDTGVFDDDRYWIVEVDYVKADPTDLLMTVRVTNAGPDGRHACTCCRRCGSATPGRGTSTRQKPRLHAERDGAIAIDHPFLGELELVAGAGPDGAAPIALFCENETNTERLFGAAADHAVPEGRHQRPRRQRPRHREPATDRARRRRSGTSSHVAPGCDRRDAPAAASGGRSRPASAGARRTTSTRSSPSGAARPTSSTPS